MARPKVTSLFDGPLRRAEADRIAQLFKAIAGPARLQIVSLINHAGEATVTDLIEATGLAQPTVTHHLRRLADAGLIQRSKDGRFTCQQIDLDRFTAIADLLKPAAR